MLISRRIRLRMRNVSENNLYSKSKHTFYVQEIFSRKSCPLWDNVEKYGRPGQATHENKIRRMRSACRVIKARIQTPTDTQNM